MLDEMKNKKTDKNWKRKWERNKKKKINTQMETGN